jgi:phage-related protein
VAITVGSVEVDVVPNTQGIYQRLRGALVPAATRAGEDAGNAAGRSFGPAMQRQIGDVGLRIGQQIGSQIAARITAEIRGALRDGITQGGAASRPAATRQGEETGGAFARAMKARLQAAFRTLPKIDVGADTSEADSNLQALRVRMEALAGKRIGVDIDAADARAEIVAIEAELRALGASHPNVTIRTDSAAALVQLKAVREEIDRISADPAHIQIETDGFFGQKLRAAVERAEAALPNININADTTPAEIEIARLRAQLTAMKDLRIGIDIDAATAQARLAEIQQRLHALAGPRVTVDADTTLARAALTNLSLRIDALRGRNPTIDVRVDAAAASAQLAAVGVMASALDAKRVNINVSAAQALAAVFQLSIAIGGLAAIPAIPILAAGIGSIAAAGVAAAAGVGALGLVAIPAFKGIASALQAQKAAQDAATNATYQGGQSAGQGAAKALQLAGAQQSLATAHRNAARQISQAEQAVGDAVRSSAEANRQAAQQVKAARQSLADVVEQAADRQEQAAERVAQAEESLAGAQRTARQAQQDLTQARKDASAELAGLADQLTNARLSERDAVLDVQDAQARLRATQAVGSKATVLEQQRAQLSYDQAVQRLKEQKTETKNLAGEKAAADKAGVEGSDTVKSAQQRLADAEKGVADQQKDLAKARSEASKQQIQNQQDIAAAQQKVAEASRNVSRVQEDGARSVQRAQESLVAAQQSAADSISSAQRQIQSASTSAAGGVDQAAIAAAKYKAELAKLSPAARDTFDAFGNLKTAFGDWSKSLQPEVMPIFTRALDGLRNALPGLTPFVEGAVRAITKLQDKISQGFKSPWWKTFKEDLATSVEPAIVGLGTAFGNIFVGMGGVIGAFLPHMDDISGTMQRITKRFADWGKNLKGSPEFERFLDYASRQGPIVAEALGDVASAFYQVAKSLSPLTGPALKILGAMARAAADLARDLPWLVQGIYLVVIATKLWTLAMFLFGLVVRTNPIILIITGIIALVAAVIYAYKNFTWFRNVVQGTWSAIQKGASYAWNVILKPIFDKLSSGLKTVGGWASWLWQEKIKPGWDAMAKGARILATIVLTILIVPLVLAFKGLAWIAGWVWREQLKPAFDALGAGAKWVWETFVKPAFDKMVAGFKLLGAGARWVWEKVISPVFNKIAEKAKWLWNVAVRPQLELLKRGFRAVGDGAKWVWDKILSKVFNWIGDKARWLWDKAIRPQFDLIKRGIKAVGTSFETAGKFIDKQWSKVQGIAKKPVRFIIDKVYNAGIVPTWNKIASAFGAPKIAPMQTKGWATGGVLPGYTPGKDVHSFYSPTGGGLELSGGEAIMRPEFTRAVGSGFINTMNKIASNRGSTGVKAALAPALGGNPAPTQRFADGGIFGWISKTAAGVGSKAWEAAKGAASWIKDGIEASARAGIKIAVDPLLAKFPGADKGFGKMVRKIPTKMLSSMFGYTKKADKAGGNMIGGAGMAAGLKWAKTQNGKRYQWGGNGNPSWDCSGLVSAIESVIRGQKPHRRWATGSFSGKTAPPGWTLNAKSPYRIGITNAGVGHTAGTINGTNVESRGGDGVVIGPRARAWNDRLFGSHYGYTGKYDQGGYLQPGMNLAYNGTGRPEPVFTTQQANALATVADGGGTSGPTEMTGTLLLDSGELMGTFRGVVRQENAQVLTALRARPAGR